MTAPHTFRILGFCCRWCSYSAADLAGAMRLQYPPEVRIILVPCTGRVDIEHLLKAFEAGADAVFVSGCHEGECHYLSGNLYARKRVARMKAILKDVGLEPERVEMFHVGASEGPKFAQICQEMADRVRKLGHSPIRTFSPAASGALETSARDLT